MLWSLNWLGRTETHLLSILGIAVLVAALVPTVAAAQGTQTYTYPGTDADTQFAIGNFNSLAVATTTTFYDGSTGDSTDHVVVLAPGTQTRFTADSIGLGSFEGSTVVSADLPVAVTATVELSDTSFENMLPVDSAVELVLPLGALAGSQVEVVIFNPGAEEAAARVIIVDEGGNALNFSDRTIEPLRTDNVGFGASENARYAVIRTSNFFLGGRPVSAGAIVRTAIPPEGVNRQDVSFVPGRAVLAEPASTRLPLFKEGGGFQSVVQVINNANTAQSITLTAIGTDGQPIDGGNNPATIEVLGQSQIPGRGVHTESVEDLFAISDVDLQVGSILVAGSSRLSAAVGVGAVSEPGFAILQADGGMVQHFAYQIQQVGREIVYELSLQNTSTGPANVDMTFVLDDGTVVSTISMVVPGDSHIVAPLAALFPEAQGDGAVVLHSDVPLVASGLESRRDDQATSVLPPLPAAPDFMAGPPTELFAVGTVRSNGVGLQGVTVTLTGTEAGTALTDAAGTFLFDDLSAGSYALTADAIGYSLAPPAINFAISTDPSRNNDFTASLVAPVITNVTPSAAPVGSPDTEIVVEGGPFISTSVVRFGNVQVVTNVVNSQLILATIPASQMQVAVQRNVVVRNVGLAEDFVDSNPVVFNVGTPPPTLLSLTGQPDPLIAGSPGFDLTVLGAGFIPGATVSVDGLFRPATFISDTQLRVAIATSELVDGGFLPVRALNPGPAVPSNPLNLVVLNPPPTVTGITPDTTQVLLSPTLPPLPMTVTGTGFQDEAVVLVDSVAVPTVFVSATTLTASVPASLLTLSGVHDVQVTNPDPSVGPSFAFPLTLTNPAPVLTQVSGTVGYDPAQSGSDQPAPVVLGGANFVPNSTVWASLPCDALGFRLLPNLAVPDGFETRRLSPTTMTATVNLQCAGNYSFQVRSPQPGGGTSATVILVVP